MKKLIGLLLLLSASSVHAAKISVTVGDGSLQPGTTAGFNVSSGTAQNFRFVNGRATGTFTLQGGTFTLVGSTVGYSASVTTGTILDQSTRTFQGGGFSGLRNDNSTVTYISSQMLGSKTDQSTTTFSRVLNPLAAVRFNNEISTITGGMIQLARPDDGNYSFAIGHSAAPNDDAFVSNGSGASYLKLNANSGVSIYAGESNLNMFSSTRPVAAWVSSFTVAGGAALKGTTTNDSAGAGNYGEFISSVSVTTKNFPTSTQFGDVLSMTVPAGDWDVTGVLYTTANGATVTEVSEGISTTSGNSSAGLVFADNQVYALPPTLSADSGSSIPVYRMSFASPTTVYLKFRAAYSVATPKASGRLSARRMR